MSLRVDAAGLGLAALAAVITAGAMVASYVLTPLVVPLGVAVVVAAVVAVTDPRLTLYGALLAIPLSLDSLPFTGGAISPTEALLVATAVGWVVRCTTSGRSPFRWSTAAIALTAFTVLSVPGAILGEDPTAGAKLLLMGTALLVVFHFVSIESDTRMLLVLLGCLVVAAAAVSLLTAFGPGQAAMNYVGSESFQRESGVFAHSNTLATFVIMALPASIALALAGPRHIRVPSAAASAAILIALGLTLSRGGVLAAAAALGAMMLWAPFRRVALVFAAVAVIFLSSGVRLVGDPVLLGDVGQKVATVREASQGDDPRVAIWKGSIKIIEDHPVLGVGAGAFGVVAPSYGLLYPLGSDLLLAPPHAHNVFLNIAAERGLPALVAFVCFLCSIAACCLTAVRQRRGLELGLAVAVSAGVFAFLVQGLVDYTLSTNVIGGVFFVLTGAAVALASPAEGRAPRRG